MKTNTQNKNTETGLQDRIAQVSSQTSMSHQEILAETFRAIFFRGPQPKRNHDGDEIPIWFVFLGDTDGQPVRTCYELHSYRKAEALAKEMADDRKLELIHEAQPAC